ncbi:unnamed protein product [Brassica rapa]|uniref:3-hydroxyacyl-CoA dehydrogenase NAD binding domain-containing protein n=2 Tax=Brassica TaxID=3705 RepID=A0A8D9GLK2_BRACM|nr:unnamed protein product [Brassica napus]CAG7882845.1 unnamed protein product [Brassica rapa]
MVPKMKHLLHKLNMGRNSDVNGRLRDHQRACCRWRICEENGRDRLRLGVVSACPMGSGITQFASTNGLDVWLMDADGNALSRATTAISSSVNRFVSKGLMTKARFSR